MKFVVKPLNNWRRFKGLTQQELADAVSINIQTIAEYERNTKSLRRASVYNLKKVADALDIQTDNIFYNTTQFNWPGRD